MRNLFLILLATSAWATGYNITGVTILGTSGVASTSTCLTTGACNGWVAEFQSSASVAAGGTAALGIVQSANNSPSTAKIVFTVTSIGYKDCTGTQVTNTRLVFTARMRCASHTDTAATNDDQNNGSNFYIRVALSEPIYSSDTVTAQVVSSFYTDGSGNTLNALSAGSAVTNSSTLTYTNSRTLANWSRVGWQRITGATFQSGSRRVPTLCAKWASRGLRRIHRFRRSSTLRDGERQCADNRHFTTG